MCWGGGGGMEEEDYDTKGYTVSVTPERVCIKMGND